MGIAAHRMLFNADDDLSSIPLLQEDGIPLETTSALTEIEICKISMDFAVSKELL